MHPAPAYSQRKLRLILSGQSYSGVRQNAALAQAKENHNGAHRKAAAVMVIFTDTEDGPGLLFTKRSATLGQHAGQISFPGGAIEADDASSLAAALRETGEEIGIQARELEIWASLPSQPVLDSWLIHPFAAWWLEARRLAANPNEVEKIIIAPLKALYEQHKLDCWMTPDPALSCRYELGGETLWGATARITGRLLDRIAGHYDPSSFTGRLNLAPTDVSSV